MNVAKPAEYFCIVNVFLAIVFGGFGYIGWINSVSKPFQVWGNWTNIDTLHINFTQANTMREEAYGYHVFLYSVPGLPSLQNLTFVSITVSLRINFSSEALFGVGYALVNETWPLTLDNQGYLEPNYDLYPVQQGDAGLQPIISANVTSIDWKSQSSDDRTQPLWFPRTGSNGGYEPIWDYYAKTYTVYSGDPCFFWTGNGTVSLDYVETYKYIPLDHLDNSTIESGNAILAALPPYVGSLLVSDLVVAAVLVGFWRKKEEKEC